MSDLTPQESIKEAEDMQGKDIKDYEDSRFNPAKNPDVISIMKQGDGNYKAWGQKNGKLIEIRAGKPEDVLAEFLIQG